MRAKEKGTHVEMGRIAFGSITGDQNVDCARALRVIVAALDDDLIQVAAVAEEVAADSRGAQLAHWELTVSLAVTLARTWAGQDGVSAAKAAVHRMLLKAQDSSQ